MAKAEATGKPDKRKDRHRFLALQEPRITVLTDQPLATGDAYRESFALDLRNTCLAGSHGNTRRGRALWSAKTEPRP